MALNYKKCRVCGKEYKACNPLGRKSKTFRWQSISCSPECGSIFLERILASRSETADVAQTTEPEVSVEELYIPPIDDEDIEDEFEDGEEDE